MLSRRKVIIFRGIDRLSVSAVCKEAEITRSTFYIHYENLSQVLNELIEDALNLTNKNINEKYTMHYQKIESMNRPEIMKFVHDYEFFLLPCQRIADSKKYRILLKDESISAYIVNILFKYQKQSMLPHLRTETDLSEDDAALLLYFIINGSCSLNNYMGWKKDETWYSMWYELLVFIYGGYKALKERNIKP